MKPAWRYHALALVVWLGYVALTYDPAQYANVAVKYHITPAVVLIILASIQLPILVCWLFGASGWLYFRQYVDSLPGDAADRRGYRLVLWGLQVLILGLVLPSLIRAAYTKYAGAAPGPVETWIATYTTLVFPLIGFFLASLGSERLLGSLKLKSKPWLQSMTALIPMAVFAIF